MVDKGIVLRKLADVETYLWQLREYAGLTPEAYRSDWKVQRIVERTLQMVIETCVDIADHVISDGRMRTPTSYADTFRVLLENGVIDEEVCAIMERMAKFRNVVVHQYEGVDAEIVTRILERHLADVSTFKAAILRFLK